jgi:Rad3-related DNA helicase
LIFHAQGDFDEQFALFAATPGSVFCSPRALEGLDLHGDACEFVVFIKIPFPFLGDVRIRRRRDTDMIWYNLQAVIALVQGSGRAVRCASDIAPTYILDAAWPWFYMENWKLFPPYWRQARRDFSSHFST